MPLRLVNADTESDELFMRSNLTAAHPDAEALLVVSNRGRTHRLTGNPYHARELLEMGLRPETIFRCAFDFVFRAKDEVVGLAGGVEAAAAAASQPPSLAGESAAPDVDDDGGGSDSDSKTSAPLLPLPPLLPPLRIVIQIRVGDHVFGGGGGGGGGGGQDLRFADPFLDCARQVEASRLLPGQIATWYFFSDSLALRRRVAASQPAGKVVTPLDGALEHVECKFSKGAASDQACGGGAAAAMRAVVAEWAVMARGDAHVITRHSGFGRVPALVG